jgi:hypothetical protein
MRSRYCRREVIVGYPDVIELPEIVRACGVVVAVGLAGLVIMAASVAWGARR